jgi:hypothetical protein
MYLDEKEETAIYRKRGGSPGRKSHFWGESCVIFV